MGMYDLNKKLTIARQNGYIFNQINIFKIKIYSNLSNIKIHYHLRLGAPPLHRHFFREISQNHDYIQTHCNDRRNPFHFACRQWFSYNNPQCKWYNYMNKNTNIGYNYLYTCMNNISSFSRRI